MPGGQSNGCHLAALMGLAPVLTWRDISQAKIAPAPEQGAEGVHEVIYS